MSRKVHFNVLVFQDEPWEGEIKEYITRVEEELLNAAEGLTIDVVLMNEFACTKYIFETLSEVDRHAEELSKSGNIAGNAPTVRFCQRVANQLRCYVVCGLPRKERINDQWQYFNSVVVVDPDAAIQHVVDKHHLYHVDENWGCSEGASFSTVTMRLPANVKESDRVGVRTGIGICMDINPYRFQAPFDSFEFANFQLQNRAHWVVMCAAWQHSDNSALIGHDTHPSDLPMDNRSVNYWLQRIYPLLSVADDADRSATSLCQYFVSSNRCGREKDVCYAGSSCCVQTGKEIVLEEALGAMPRGYFVASLNISVDD